MKPTKRLMTCVVVTYCWNDFAHELEIEFVVVDFDA